VPADLRRTGVLAKNVRPSDPGIRSGLQQTAKSLISAEWQSSNARYGG